MERLVSFQVNGHSGVCTVMLGCTESWVHGVWDGQIHRDCMFSRGSHVHRISGGSNMFKEVHKPFKQNLKEESIAFMVKNPEGTKPAI